MSQPRGGPDADEAVREGRPGHVALDVGPAAAGPPAAPAPPGAARPAPAGPATPQLSLAVHGVEGALCSSMLAPFVRVHVLEAASGLPWTRAGQGRHPVFNVDAAGAPYLRVAPGRQEPWQADVSQSTCMHPFATKPCQLHRVRGGIPRGPPQWNEEFLVAEPLTTDAMLMFEVLDASEVLRSATQDSEGADDTNAAKNYGNLGWGFLSISSAFGANKRRHGNRRLRLQLYKYQGRHEQNPGTGGWWTRFAKGGAPDAADDDKMGRPAVFSEYRCDSIDEEATPSWMATASAVLRRDARGGHRRRSPWPAVLEVTLSTVSQALDLTRVEESINTELSISRINAGDQSLRDSTALASGSGDEGGATDGGAQEALGKLAPHNFRHKDQPCCVPDSLLWQINAGKRGASRLSLSPSGQLLAAAVARQGGASELRVFNIATGRLHAACAAVHDALVYDVCWHAFGVPGAPTGHPLLISCGGDAVVQVYEVPEESRGRAAPLLRPAARLDLPSHVYTVGVHPAMSADPRRVVLVCGGHDFGLMVCELVRQGQREGGQPAAKWTVANMQSVDMSKAFVRSTLASESPGQSLSSPLKAQRHAEPESTRLPDVLCVRFSTQPTTPDNMYVTDAAGRVMLFQACFDASLQFGQGNIRVSFVRVYSAPDLLGVPIYSMDVVTPHLVQGGRLNQIQVSIVDDWVLLFSRDHLVRLCSLQRGAARVELQLSGLESGSYPVRGAMSPDGAYVACGSETGELLLWDARDGRPLPPGAAPGVRLAGPVMDVAWSARHHLLACCALDAQAPPLLLFAGGDPAYRPPPEPPGGRPELPLRPVPPREAREAREEPAPRLAQTPLSVAPVAAARPWAAQWLELDGNPRSALALEEKRAMKERILAQLLDRRGAAELEQHFASVRIPGGL